MLLLALFKNVVYLWRTS